MENKDNNTSNRRNFLQGLGLAGLGSVVGGMALYSGYHYDKKKIKNSKITLLTSDSKLVEVNAEDIQEKQQIPLTLTNLQKRGREGIKGRRWVMVVDLSKCRNARKCMKACQSAHNLYPEQHHINVLEMQDSENTAPYFMPKPCMHCDNPPCVAVCPVDATFKRQDGIVLIDNERCIGCRFCVAACPYSARVFHWKEPKNKPEDIEKTYDVELNTPQRKGTITKCLFSADRCREGELPYCVSACPNGTYYFGDENEDAVTNGTTKETVALSKLLEENAGYVLMPELGTKPRVYYLPPKNRLFPFEENRGEHKENEA
jgi:Fe-S-cluster-containing dehydrogenase component